MRDEPTGFAGEPRNISCEEALRLLHEDLDDTLIPRDALSLRSHTFACESCLRYGEALMELDGSLHLRSVPAMSDGFADRVMAGLDRAPGSGGSVDLGAGSKDSETTGLRMSATALLGPMCVAASVAALALLLPVDAGAAVFEGLPKAPIEGILPPEGWSGIAAEWAVASAILPDRWLPLAALAAAAAFTVQMARLRRGGVGPVKP